MRASARLDRSIQPSDDLHRATAAAPRSAMPLPSIAQWPAEQSNPVNVRRERQRVLRAHIAGWPEWVEASQAG